MYLNLYALALVTAADTTQPVSGGDILSFLQFGVVGLLVVLFMTRKGIVPEWTLRTEEKRAAAERAALIEAATNERTELAQRLADKEAQVERLQGIFEEQVLPALWRATEMNRAYEEFEARMGSERASTRTPRTRRGPAAKGGDDES